MKKLIESLFVICAISSFFAGVHAATANDELLSYITKDHIVAGTTLTLTAAQRTQVERYISDNMITVNEVVIFKSKIEEVKSIMTDAGVTDLTKLSNLNKNKVTNLIIEAGRTIGITVTVNSNNNTIELFDSTGAKLDVLTFNGGKLPFTGSSFVLYNVTATIVAMVAMFYIFKKRII